MKLLPTFERNVLARSKNMNFFLEMDSIEDLTRVISYIKQHGTTIYDVELSKAEDGTPGRVRGSFTLRLPKRRQHTEILAAIAKLDGVVAIEEI